MSSNGQNANVASQQLITASQAAQICGVSVRTITRWAHQGVIPTVGRAGRVWLFQRGDVQRFATHEAERRCTP